ncbi:MAG: GNAT family N-acetyltransferase [Mucilaginibacter polytrichastri]|nr:GNAT family N-acetyltransferase [Mucilaginibacter polytrichastri]
MTIKRTDSTDPDFVTLVRELDQFLAVTDGDEHAFYAQYNKIDLIRYAIVICNGDEPVGCGAIKTYAPGTMEVKRMFTRDTYRGKGIAGMILNELETWAAELDSTRCILETGLRQTAAIRLYEKSGYARIENYGQYAGVANSVCFGKNLVLTQK